MELKMTFFVPHSGGAVESKAKWKCIWNCISWDRISAALRKTQNDSDVIKTKSIFLSLKSTRWCGCCPLPVLRDWACCYTCCSCMPRMLPLSLWSNMDKVHSPTYLNSSSLTLAALGSKQVLKAECLCALNIHMLDKSKPPTVMVFGSGTFGKWLHSDEVIGVGPLWWDWCPCRKRKTFLSLCSCTQERPCEHTMKRWPSTS